MIASKTYEAAWARFRDVGEAMKRYQRHAKGDGPKPTEADETLIAWMGSDMSTILLPRAELMKLLERHKIKVSAMRLSQLQADGFLEPHEMDLWPAVDTLAGLARWWRHGGRDTKEGTAKAKLENARLETEQRRINLAKDKKELLDTRLVGRVWKLWAEDVAARVRTADIPEEVKSDILKDCHQIPYERYFPGCPFHKAMESAAKEKEESA